MLTPFLSRILRRSAAAVLIAISYTGQAFPQTFRGAINGSILDPSGAAVGEATVVATQDATGVSRRTASSSAGEFSLPDLPLGVYTVTVQKTGFQDARRARVEVVVSTVTTLNINLGVASQVATVEIKAEAPLVETGSTAITGVVGQQIVSDLPLNGRDFRQILKLTPGVGNSGGPTSVNGSRTRGNNYEIDGSDNNDGFQNFASVNQGGVAGIPGVVLPVDAIDQLSVQTGGTAEAGRNGSASINLAIKSGTNQFHGTAFDFLRNEALSANSPFAAPGSAKRVIRNNQPGFSLGGPVFKNRTFFFVSGEVQNAIAGNSTSVTTPSAAWIAQANQVLNRYNVAVNPVSLGILKFFPAGALTGPATGNNFTGTDPSKYISYNGIIKVDHQINSKNNLAVRYFGGTGKQTALVNSSAPYEQYYQVAPIWVHNYSVVLNSVLTPRLVNQVVLGVNYFKQTFNDNDTSAIPGAIGLNTGVTDPALSGAPTINISGFAIVGATQPTGRIDTVGHVIDTLSYNIGRHQIKVGGEFRRAAYNVFYRSNQRGSLSFNGAQGPWATDSTVSSSLRALSDFLAGYVSATNGATIARGNLERDYRHNTYSGYVHDTFQITPHFSINAGLRWDHVVPLSDVDNSLTTFLPSRGLVPVSQGNGSLDSLYPSSWKNFSPRFGFAYSPGSSERTVVRGSYGVYYDTPAIAYFSANTPGNGAAPGVNGNPAGISPVFNLTRNAFTLVSGQAIFAASPTPPFGAFSVNQDFRLGYVQNFSLNVQRQLSASSVVQVGYVGSLGRALPITLDINAALPGTGSTQSRRPYNSIYPTLGAINELQSVASSSFHSLQVTLNQKLWRGLTAKVAYTFGHAIDDASDARSTIPANSYNIHSERGNAVFDIRHNFVTYLSYSLPSAPLVPRVIGAGWQLNTLVTAQTGSPINIQAGTNPSGSGDGTDRVDLIGDPFALTAVKSGTSIVYLNRAAFAAPTAGTFGNLGRNAIYGPGFFAVDPSLFKNFRVTERVSLQLRAEMFNALNWANRANPTTTLTSAAFGLIGNTKNGSIAPGLGFGEPRNTQLALKLQF
jgi:hypothetical protein